MVYLWKKFNGDGWEVTKPLENHWWQWCPQKIILPSHRWKKWPSYRSMRNCGQGSSVLWPVCGTRIGPLAPVRRCEILEFKTGEEGRGRWEWVGPTILPTALWADCAVLIINYDSVFDTELYRNWWKSAFFYKTLCTRKFSMGKFFEGSTHGILTN